MIGPASGRGSERRGRAQALADDLRNAAQSESPSSPEAGLTEEVAQALSDRFARQRAAVRAGAAAADGRGEREYWADHGRLTGELMAVIAHRSGAPPLLYDRVGRLHDLDYLAHPHDAPGPGERHPVPLVKAMRVAGVHPTVCLAVLEHAPYVGLCDHPSSRLSAALSCAEDLATLAALQPASASIGALSSEASILFRQIVPECFIRRERTVRVEVDVDRYINVPLSQILDGTRFDFPV
jgi:hypothetical protein